MAQARFSAETADGWQQVMFSTPVQIAADTDYVASYHTNVGNYSVTPGFFTSAGYDNAPLHAPGNATNPNGLFAYSPFPTFPAGTYNGNNYYVDAVYTPLPLPTSIAVTDPTAGPVSGSTEQLDAVATYGDATTSDISSAVA